MSSVDPLEDGMQGAWKQMGMAERLHHRVAAAVMFKEAVNWPNFFNFADGRQGFNRPGKVPLSLPKTDDPVVRHVQFALQIKDAVKAYAWSFHDDGEDSDHRFRVEFQRSADAPWNVAASFDLSCAALFCGAAFIEGGKSS